MNPQDHQHIRQQELQPVGGVVGVIGIVPDDALVVLLLHQVVQIVVKHLKVIQVAADGAAVGQLGGEPGVADGELLHLFVQKQLPHLGIADGVLTAQARSQVIHQTHGQQHQQDGPQLNLLLLAVK